ncbi:hypothetical protein ACFO5R_09645 [Halosolutus amylolyticus]|uniref:Outer membrane lipoprotein-sorting protein n=1 Tax=Halosolutus amylolyticus TaxID=2932267 RepID=A0ABD5PQH4_9EURY|nr:hypothetical protein [Halosolutus amylolyticus]
METRGVRVAAVVVTALALVLAGCTMPVGDDREPDGTELIESAIDERATVDGLQGVRTTTVNASNGTVSTTVRVWERPPMEHRSEVLEASGPEAPGDLIVSNGSETWTYDAEDDTAMRYEGPVEGPESGATDADELLEGYDVAYQGTETIGQWETHVVELNATDERPIERSIGLQVGDTEYVLPLSYGENATGERTITRERWWIDRETSFPVKQRIELDGPGSEPTTITVEYDELKLDADPADDRFAFEPPANATVAEPANLTTVESPADAAASASVSVPDPRVPAEYERRDVTVEDDGSAVALFYEHEDDPQKTIYVETATEELDVLEYGEVVAEAVGPIDATHIEFPTMSTLVWTCGGQYYDVSAPLGVDALLAIATSIDCR